MFLLKFMFFKWMFLKYLLLIFAVCVIGKALVFFARNKGTY
jgi:hypothetical protein